MEGLDGSLVDAIVREVLKRLNPAKSSRVLVLLCGGTRGAGQAREQLAKLNASGYELSAAFTYAGSRVLGKAWLGPLARDINFIDETTEKTAAQLLEEIDMVVVPVLTINSAAKLAHGIADNLVTNLIRQSLFSGIPVLAARDACDLNSPEWQEVLSNRASDYLRSLSEQNLAILKKLGMHITAARDIAEKVTSLGGKQLGALNSSYEKGASPSALFRGRVLSAKDVLACNEKDLYISQTTIVTPAAKDLARERAVEISVK